MSGLAQLLTAPPVRAAGMKIPAPADETANNDETTGFFTLLTAVTDNLDGGTDAAPDDQEEQPASVAVPTPPVLPSPSVSVTLPSIAPGSQPTSTPAILPPAPVPMPEPTAEPSPVADAAPAAPTLPPDTNRRLATATPSPPAAHSSARSTGQAVEAQATAAATLTRRPAAPAVQPASTPAAAPAAAPAAMSGAALATDDSPDTGQDPKGDSPRQPVPGVTISQKFNVSSVEQGPFRLDVPNLTSVTQERLMETAETLPSAVTPPAVSAGEEVASPEMPIADISIEPGEGQRLDVTLAATSPDAATRLRADSRSLEADLAALGAEVEAIRVELRGPRAPDGGVGSGTGSPSPQAPAPQHGQADAQGQQGGAYRKQGEAASSTRSVLPDAGEQEATARAAPPGGGKVDRYA